MAKKLSRYLPGLSLDAAPQAPKKAVKQQKRNGHAFHPIMAKGGVHEKSKSAQRAAAKQQTNRKAREWLGRPSLPTLNQCTSVGNAFFSYTVSNRTYKTG